MRMNRLKCVVGGLCVIGLASGCLTATKVVHEPRVDLELSGGNHGYLVGTPPPSSISKTTRDMVETEVEIPSSYKPLRPGGATMGIEPVSVGEGASSGMGVSEATPGRGAEAVGTYVVKRGDTLWTIAADPAVYGDATKWRRLYDANRDLLKSPDRVRPGMRLRVPGASREQTTFTK